MDPLEGLRLEKLESLHETRAGMPYYNGSAHRFTEWKFKIMNRHRSATATADEEVRKRNLSKLLSDIIDALSDQALRIAMNMSDEEMSADDAITTLITRIETNFNKNVQDTVNVPRTPLPCQVTNDDCANNSGQRDTVCGAESAKRSC